MSKLPRRFVPVAGVARKQGLKVQRSHKSETPDAANFLDVSSRKCLNGRGAGGRKRRRYHRSFLATWRVCGKKFQLKWVARRRNQRR
jgi:hypothetical protein